MALLLPACAGAPAPPSAPPQGNFTLYVSNQSFAVDPVDIQIRIDGKLVVDEKFKVGNQHNWKAFGVQLDPGPHELKATSSKGQATLTTTFTTGERNWGVVDYWYYPKATGGAGPTPRSFSFNVSDKPIGFR